MNNEQIKQLVEIAPDEKIAFKKLIIKHRKKLIASAGTNVYRALQKNKQFVDDVTVEKNVTDVIYQLGEAVYTEFLEQEAKFNSFILNLIGEQLQTPKYILNELIDKKLLLNSSNEKLVKSVKEICGQYAGHISPFIYELSLSNTQSRRSRAGKTFEAIIYILYEAFDYPYVSQKSIGRKLFSQNDLGKIVDSLLPSVQAFTERRDKVVIGTMKTTLRERWQEVIEEQSRTNLPNIYLLTLDSDISENKAKQMGSHNVIIVVPQHVKKQTHLLSKRNIISFEQYFLEEIPEKLAYWSNQYV